MYFIGIDIGASSIKVAVVDSNGCQVASARRAHAAAPLTCLAQMLTGAPFAELSSGECAGIALTGSGAALVQAACKGLPSEHDIIFLEEIPALTQGVKALVPQANTVVSMGAQSTFFITNVGEGGIPEFAMNENCAAGTGSFFEDQMERLGLSLDDYSKLVGKARSVPRLSGRCSVFAKTDIIHRQQEGVPVEDILQGLCHATVKAFRATIVRGAQVKPPVALTGGTLLNVGVVRAVHEVFGLEADEVLASENLLFAQALGAALHAMKQGREGTAKALAATGAEDNTLLQFIAALSSGVAGEDLDRLAPLPNVDALVEAAPSKGYRLAPLPWQRPKESESKEQAGVFASKHSPIPVALGIDVGSTSTNVVMLGLDGSLYDAQYLRTRGNPKKAVRQGIDALGKRVAQNVQVVAVGVTGSGRGMIGKLVGADAVRDEITAQARGAVAADPNVDTVFEIGGQDSKYICIKEGRVADFQMNKVCAAGTGSFVEEQAARLGIALPDYGKVAFAGKAPVDLGERCTVFVETAVHAALAKGASKADIASGLCLSIVRNYLHKVVGTKPVGERIVLQGGVAYNPAIVSAFYAYAGDALTVSPYFAVSGAVGAALLALEAQGIFAGEGGKANEGSPTSESDSAVYKSIGETAGQPTEGSFSAAAPQKVQLAHLPRSNFKGWGLAGDAAEKAQTDSVEIAANRAFFHKVDELYEEGYTPEQNNPQKPTVGIPRALMLHKLFPMANAFFKALGYNVYLSPVSNEETVRASQQCAQGETCYPVKLVHGHMAQLAEAGVDYVFMPRVHTIRHAKSTVDHNYACPYMQAIPQIVAQELNFEERGITLLSPVFDMDFGQSAMAKALLSVGAQLGKTPQESARAMLAGGFAVSEFTRKTEALGDELLAGLKPGERVFVLVTRNYGIVDPALNMGIPDMLLNRGCKVITVSHLHAHDLSIEPDYPDMYWPFGQHMISGAKLIARDPRMFMIYLTNHGCGPDTMVSHLISAEMGEKPYLQIEMDEHYSKVGVETRIEAFLNAVDQYQPKDLRSDPTSSKVVNVRCVPLEKDAPTYLLEMGPYSSLFKAQLDAEGHNAQIVPYGSELLDLGRSETTSKEYLTFAAYLGSALDAAKTQVGSKTTVQILVLGSQGGEADGQYARVIQSILDEKHVPARVVSPSLELLPCTQANIEALFCCLLAGDVVQAACAQQRQQLLVHLRTQAGGPEGLGIEDVIAAAADVAKAAAAGSSAARKNLAVVGEWPLAVADTLVNDTWSILEGEGYCVRRMPLAEYLLFLWHDAFREAEHEKVVGEVIPLLGEGMGNSVVGLPDTDEPASHCGTHAEHDEHDEEEGCSCAVSASQQSAKLQREVAERELAQNPLNGAREQKLPREEWAAALQKLRDMLHQVHQALGKASPYSGDWEQLEQFALQGMELYAGAGGRYRFAKAQQAALTANGVIMVSSLYENTDTVIRLKTPKLAAPSVSLTFDGVLDQGLEERLRSFLYYL